MKKGENKIVKNHKFMFQSLLDSLSGIIILLDRSGRIVYLNDAAVNFVSSVDIDDYLEGKNYFKLLNQFDGITRQNKNLIIDSVKNVLEGENNSKKIKFSFNSSDKKKWYMAEVTHFAGAGPFTVVINQQEITEEVILNGRYKKLIDNLPEIITWHSDLDKLVYVNSAVEESLGIKKEELLSIDDLYEEIYNYLPKEVVEIWKKNLQKVSRDKEKVEFETSLKSNNGKRFFKTKIVPCISEDNLNNEFLGITREITEEKAIRKNLVKQQVLFKQLFENSPFAVLLVNAEDCVLRVNQSFQELYKFSEQDIKGKNIFDFVVPVERKKEAKKISQVVLSGEEMTRETFRLTATGEKIEISLTSFPVILNNNKMGRYIIYNDVRERKIAERLYRRAQERFLEEKEREEEMIRSFNRSFVRSLVKLLEFHDPYTCGHSHEVALLARDIAVRMGLSDRDINNSYWAGLVHDAGKLLIPKKILVKTGELNEEEYDIVKKHIEWGYEALQEFNQLKDIALYVKHHHERWDGSGYPDGLSGDSIPVISTIIRVADIWITLLAERSYRSAYNREEAFAEMEKGRGSDFSPVVFDVFADMFGADVI